MNVRKLRVTGPRPETGATAVEYGLLVALIAAVIIGTVVILGQGVVLKLFEAGVAAL